MARAQIPFGDGSASVIAAGLTALPFPTFAQMTSASWRSSSSVPSEFDLEIWSNSVVDLTFAELYGGSLQPLVYADNAITTVAFATDLFTKVAHALLTGDGPIQLTTTGVLPAGLALATSYWIIRISADTFKLASSFALAVAGTAIDIADDGSGTHTIVDVATTERIHWNSYGLLGKAADGAVGLTSIQGYMIRALHHPRNVIYALSATLSAPNAVWASIYPVQEI